MFDHITEFVAVGAVPAEFVPTGLDDENIPFLDIDDREMRWLRLVGRLSWLLDPAYRGQGLGTLLMNNFIRIGQAYGLRHLTCMLISDLEADAVATLRGLGFGELKIEGYGSDPDGNPHDMIKLYLRL